MDPVGQKSRASVETEFDTIPSVRRNMVIKNKNK